MKPPEIFSEVDADRLGQQFSRRLNDATQDLGHDICERLRIARQRALQSRPQVSVLNRRLAFAAHANSTLTGWGDEGLSIWRILASVIPLISLVMGLLLIQSLQSDHSNTDVALIDAALLTDELPPDAYTDPGFVQFLKLQLVSPAQHD